MEQEEQEEQQQNIALSVTTRGIGLAACNLCHIAAAAGIEAPVYAMYRVFLGLTEAKVGIHNGVSAEGITDENRYECKVRRYVLDMPMTVTVVPTPIKRIIDAIDIIEHKGMTYVPVVAAQVRDTWGFREKLIPRPENLLLSNLREVVVALSTPDTYDRYRASFKTNCPIPGAVWVDNLLTNADEIIPEGYCWHSSKHAGNNFTDDMWSLHMFLLSLQEKYPLMASGPLSRSGTNVSLAAFISNDMDNACAKPRLVGEPLQAYCRRCHPQGSLRGYCRLDEVSDADTLLGQMALLGEQPDVLELGLHPFKPVLPVHAARRRLLGFTRYYLRVQGTLIHVDDYVITMMMTNEALLSPSAPRLARGARGRLRRPPPPPPPARDGGRRRLRKRRGSQNTSSTEAADQSVVAKKCGQP